MMDSSLVRIAVLSFLVAVNADPSTSACSQEDVTVSVYKFKTCQEQARHRFFLDPRIQAVCGLLNDLVVTCSRVHEKCLNAREMTAFQDTLVRVEADKLGKVMYWSFLNYYRVGHL